MPFLFCPLEPAPFPFLCGNSYKAIFSARPTSLPLAVFPSLQARRCSVLAFFDCKSFGYGSFCFSLVFQPKLLPFQTLPWDFSVCTFLHPPAHSGFHFSLGHGMVLCLHSFSTALGGFPPREALTYSNFLPTPPFLSFFSLLLPSFLGNQFPDSNLLAFRQESCSFALPS